MSDDPIKRALGYRRTPSKPHPWWRKALVAICRYIPWCDGDPTISVRKK